MRITLTYNDGSTYHHPRTFDPDNVIAVVENRKSYGGNQMYCYCTLYFLQGLSLCVDGTHAEVTKRLGWS